MGRNSCACGRGRAGGVIYVKQEPVRGQILDEPWRALMAIQYASRTELWDHEIAPTIEFPAHAGIPPSDLSKYQKDDVLRAILARDWEVDFVRETDPPGWGVEIRTWWAPGVRQAAYGVGPNRVSALLDALRDALTLVSAEESQRQFDEMAQEWLDMSRREFIEKFRAGELDPNDSRVFHLHVSRPVDW